MIKRFSAERYANGRPKLIELRIRIISTFVPLCQNLNKISGQSFFFDKLIPYFDLVCDVKKLAFAHLEFVDVTFMIYEVTHEIDVSYI